MVAKFPKNTLPVERGVSSGLHEALFPTRDASMNEPPDLDGPATLPPARGPALVPPPEPQPSVAPAETATAGHPAAAGPVAETTISASPPAAAAQFASLDVMKIAPDPQPMQSAFAEPGSAPPMAGTHDASAAESMLDDASSHLVPPLQALARWLPKTKDVTDLTLSLEGEAVAVGADTVADGEMFARLIDKGAVSVAYGSATFSAVAESTGSEFAFASAFSDAHVSGADFVISWTQHQTLNLQSDDGQFAKDVSTTYVFAVDFEAWDLRGGPITIDANKESLFQADLAWLADLIDGNVATFEFDVQAVGPDTYADVAASVLALEDELSSVAAAALLGIA